MQVTKLQLEKTLRGYFPFGFPLSRKSWDRYDVSTVLGTSDLDDASAQFRATRKFADRFIREQLRKSPTDWIHAGQLISAGVIVDVLRYLVLLYCHQDIPGAIGRGLDWTGTQRGRATVEQPPPLFTNLFPPLEVGRGQQTEDVYLRDVSQDIPNNEIVTGEMILLALSSANPAFSPFRGLFNDTDLQKGCPYTLLVDSLEEYFGRQPAFAPLGKTLFECLRAPIEASPDSLQGQLNYMRNHWADFLPPELLEKLLLATDILKEEEKLRGFGPGPVPVLEFGDGLSVSDFGYSEPARFSHDADWMSNVVIIAKSTYIWLDQLSKKYQRHIKLLSDIPDEELDRLARWGFTGLWLIGVWERSPASQTIKQIMGNPEAAPSAYSIYDYTVADELGGEVAYQNLRDRAWQRGIRLASDMVPNHMGIYSKWVVEHPDWFIQLDYPPYPWYQFTGTDLSWDSRVTLQIEDGYWQHRDASVIFRRTDKWTGDVKYIYHGNDGTNMPWNDTAQLNFLLPEVREAVIQMILHVARKFPIIRFDAAMTLAKKHYQRLWFPQHGDGGAIPSRAEHGMGKARFDEVFPLEFWREVVDRVATEVPDTLLLAEAFWLMEGYFVRTLGMHRVYNSAFMNMLKMEDNGKYRKTVKNVLEFSPEVLKRFVNFMNNPDEETAVAQFGKGDKYFGVAILMVTMPGLPMFGHGQIEGFTEKYGMEYRKAYWDEQIDEDMVHRHESQIFPLMRRRRLFSGAENFAFYDFNSPEGWVDENVFAYSNRAGDERAIILYNNAYNATHGSIHTSTAINTGTDEEQHLVRRSLGEALALNTSEGCYYNFRDYLTGLHYLRNGRQLAEEGLFAELHAYQAHAFLDFREIHDPDGSWAELTRRLNGGGVPNLDEAYREMKLDPILIPFREACNAEMLHGLTADDPETRPNFEQAMSRFLNAVKDFTGAETNPAEVLKDVLAELDVFPLEKRIKDELGENLVAELLSLLGKDGLLVSPVVIAWITAHHLGRLTAPEDNTDPQTLARIRQDDWLLKKIMAQAIRDFTGNEGDAFFDTLLVSILTGYENTLTSFTEEKIADTIQKMLDDPVVQEFLQVNQHNGVLWLNQEQLERMMGAILLTTIVRLAAGNNLTPDRVSIAIQTTRHILTAADDASYQVRKTIENLKSSKT